MIQYKRENDKSATENVFATSEINKSTCHAVYTRFTISNTSQFLLPRSIMFKQLTGLVWKYF